MTGPVTHADAMRRLDATRHGGRLADAMAAYPQAAQPWLDLSTGINPDPWTGARATLEELTRLPDPVRLAELEVVAAHAFGVDDPARVVATAGAEAGLRWVARLVDAARVDVVSPTYSGHEAAWTQAGTKVARIARGDLARSHAEVAVVVNPNNPDGGAVARADLVTLAQTRARRGAWTVVDESFVETRPDLSVAGLACEGLVVLRSFGKFYGLAGLRLGFAIAPRELAERLRAAQGDWPVSGEAITFGLGAYVDGAWRARTGAALAARAEELDATLASAGLIVTGGTSLFRLVTTRDADGLFARLCGEGILTRPFAEQPDWLRFGLPRAEDLPRLAQALERCVA